MLMKCRANPHLRGAGYEKATLSKCTITMPQKMIGLFFGGVPTVTYFGIGFSEFFGMFRG